MKFTFTAGESRRIQQVIDDTNNKDSRDEPNVKSRHFIFPSQKAIFNQSVNETKRSDTAMLSGEWSVEQSRAIAEGLVSLAREEDKPHMRSTNEWKIPGVNGNEPAQILSYSSQISLPYWNNTFDIILMSDC